MNYSKVILQKLEAGRSMIQKVKCIMIQSSGLISGEYASKFYDNIGTESYKKPAHYVVGSTDIYKYNYSDSSVFTQNEEFHNLAINLMNDPKESNDNPGNHILVVEIIRDTNDYVAIEKNAAIFIADILKKYNLTTNNVWRRGDIVNDRTNYIPQYKQINHWTKFIDAIKTALSELSNEIPNFDKINYSGAPINDEYHLYESDTRKIKSLKEIDSSAFLNEDFDIIKQGDIITKKDKFTGESEITGKDLYEPIYPDLVVPPVSNTNLYNESPFDVTKHRYTTKPVLGKSVNIQDPYPIDDKIAELEEHFPLIKMNNNVLNDMQNDASKIPGYLISLSQRVERRIVQLENILSTMSRYQFRLGSRININCVYYGGQSVADKYSCIRCLQDDMINDGQIVAIDQCLNCSRYEPIIGQTYEILNEDLGLDLAPILDDIQMSRMDMDDYIKFSRIENMVDDPEDAKCDTSSLSSKSPIDKTFFEETQHIEPFSMRWNETSLEEQNIDVNDYYYYSKAIYDNKKNLLKPKNKYNDYYDKIQKKKYVKRDDSYGTIASLNQSDNNSESSAGGFGYNSIDDYDWKGAEVRKSILDTSKKLIKIALQEKLLYVYGGKIKESYLTKTPDQLLGMINKGEQTSASSVDPVHTDAISIDCSGFIRYCFKTNGVNIGDGTSAQFAATKVIGKKKDFEASMLLAYPGDLIFYANGDNIDHVALYIGNGMMRHASTSKKPKNSQVLEAKVYKEKFYAVCRLESLPIPKFKNFKYININMTLDKAVDKQLPYQTDADGNDHSKPSRESVKKYLDPNNYNTGQYMYQFLDLGVYCGVTAEEIKTFLKSVDASKEFINNADAFIDASKKYNVNEVYLVAHSCLETGNGKGSKLARGEMTGPSGKKIYNVYGIGAFNSDSSRSAACTIADKNGWYTTRDAIIGGAKFVAESYIHSKQNTLYKMKWNPLNPGTHQYATDIAWAIKQTSTIGKIFDKFPEKVKSKFRYEIPVYKS